MLKRTKDPYEVQYTLKYLYKRTNYRSQENYCELTFYVS